MYSLSSRQIKSKKTKPWHEQDEFWINYAPTLFTKKTIKHAGKEVKSIIKILKLKKGQSILDLGCGIGRHSLLFAKAGFNVTALDRTAAFLYLARKKAKKEKVKIRFVLEDMRKLRIHEKFDAVVNLFSTFGFFKKKNDDLKVLKNIYASLKPGGKLLLELAVDRQLRPFFKKREISRRERAFFYRDVKVNRDWLKYTMPCLVGSKIRGFRVSCRIYSVNTLSLLLKKVGFSDIKEHGNLTGKKDIKRDLTVITAEK